MMTHMKNILFVVAVVMVIPACRKAEEGGASFHGPTVSILADSETTKASIAAPWEVVSWQSGDAISVFDGKSSVQYTTEESGTTALFTSATGVANEAKELYAAYPYRADQYLTPEGKLSVVMPSTQTIRAGQYACPEAMISVAYTSSIEQKTVLHFQNLCAWLKFTVPTADKVTDITLRASEEESIAGRIAVSFDSKGNASFEVIEGCSKVEFHSEVPLDGTYLIPLLPAVLENGLGVTLRTQDGKTAVHRIVAEDENGVQSAVVLRRNKVNHYVVSFSDPLWRNAPEPRLLGVEATSAAFAWSENGFGDAEADFSASYLLKLYKASDPATPVREVAWQIPAVANMAFPAFCFASLDPSMDYLFTVEDTETGSVCPPLAFTTPAASFVVPGAVASEGDLLLKEDFSELFQGADPLHAALGMMDGNFTAKASDLKEWQETDLSATRLATWKEKTPGANYTGPGYVRAGDSGSLKDALLTPVLSNLSSCATVEVSFKAAPFSSDFGVGNGVSRLGECYAEVWVVNGDSYLSAGVIELEDDPAKWSSRNLQVVNVLPTSRIAIGGAYGEKTVTSSGKQYARIYLDDISVKLLRYEETVAVVPPEVSMGPVFWSDVTFNWTCAGEPEGYKVYVDGNVVAELPSEALSYHLTGLAPGTRYAIELAALYNHGEEGRSAAQYITTGTVERLTKNLSPTSLAFAIENRAGDNTNNNNPLIEVELLDGPDPASAKSLFRSYVLDGQILSPGTPYFASLMVSDKKSRAPLHVAIGCLEPQSDYWFRVRSVETLTFTSYQTSTPSEQTVSSSNGSSEFSQPVKATTPSVHAPEAGEVLFEGFDCLMVQADYVNLAVGSMPAYKKSGKAANTMTYKTVKEWDGDWSFYGLRNAYGSTQLAPQYAWATQQTADNEMFQLSAQNGNGTIKGTAGTVPGIGAKIYAFKDSPDVSGSLSGWLSTNSTYAGQGYIQLGAYYNASDAVNNLLGMIVTPELTKGLSQDASLCTLSFKGLVLQGRDCALGVWKYASGTWTKLSDIALYNSAGSTSVATTWSGEADTHTWYTHSLNIELKAGDRIALEAPKAAGAALIDDIQIKLK